MSMLHQTQQIILEEFINKSMLIFMYVQEIMQYNQNNQFTLKSSKSYLSTQCLCPFDLTRKHIYYWLLLVVEGCAF